MFPGRNLSGYLQNSDLSIQKPLFFSLQNLTVEPKLKNFQVGFTKSLGLS